MKGIVLAGGRGSRLWPVTSVLNKQLLPIYDKPMVYYSLSTLMLAGVNDILIISSPKDLAFFKDLFGDGSDLGISISYGEQLAPKGIAEAFIIAEKFLDSEPSWLILGDNIFHGVGLGTQLRTLNSPIGAHIFTYDVADANQYGILTLDSAGGPLKIEEKPSNSNSNLAITGLYRFDHTVVDIAKSIKPSSRGELEITSVLQEYLTSGNLKVFHLSRGTAWLDTGTVNGIHDASSYVRIIQERTGFQIGCVEEIAYRNDWIDKSKLNILCLDKPQTNYWNFLRVLASS